MKPPGNFRLSILDFRLEDGLSIENRRSSIDNSLGSDETLQIVRSLLPSADYGLRTKWVLSQHFLRLY